VCVSVVVPLVPHFVVNNVYWFHNVAGDGAAAPPLAVPKFTIAKRNAPLPSAPATSHDTHTSHPTHTLIAPHMAPYTARDAHSSGMHSVVEGVSRMSVSAGGASSGAGGEGGNGEKRPRGRGGKGRGEGGGSGDVSASGDARVSGDGSGRGEGKGGRGGDRGSGRGSRGGRGGGRSDGPPALHVPNL